MFVPWTHLIVFACSIHFYFPKICPSSTWAKHLKKKIYKGMRNPLWVVFFFLFNTYFGNSFQNLIDFGLEIAYWVVWNCFRKQSFKNKNKKWIKQILKILLLVCISYLIHSHYTPAKLKYRTISFFAWLLLK